MSARCRYIARWRHPGAIPIACGAPAVTTGTVELCLDHVVAAVTAFTEALGRGVVEPGSPASTGVLPGGAEPC